MLLGNIFFVDNSPSVKNTHEPGLYFWLAHFCSFSVEEIWQYLTLGFDIFFFGIILEHSWFITSDHIIAESYVTLTSVQEGQGTYILLIVFLLSCENFGTILAQTFLILKFWIKISWRIKRFKFNSLLTIFNVSRRSDLTRAITRSTLSCFECWNPPWARLVPELIVPPLIRNIPHRLVANFSTSNSRIH